MPDVSANWRRDHPWAAVYDFFVERERLRRPLGQLLFGTDTGLIDRSLAAVYEVPDGGTILDLPCGGGMALQALSPQRDVRYVAADISAAMLERTAAVARARGLAQVQTRIADVHELPFADGEFDLIISFAGLHCFPRPEQAVHELARCLAAGGRLTGSVFVTDAGVRYRPHIAIGRAMGVMGPSASADELEGWFASAGLEQVHLRRSGALVYFDARRPRAR